STRSGSPGGRLFLTRPPGPCSRRPASGARNCRGGQRSVIHGPAGWELARRKAGWRRPAQEVNGVGDVLGEAARVLGDTRVGRVAVLVETVVEGGGGVSGVL